MRRNLKPTNLTQMLTQRFQSSKCFRNLALDRSTKSKEILKTQLDQERMMEQEAEAAFAAEEEEEEAEVEIEEEREAAEETVAEEVEEEEKDRKETKLRVIMRKVPNKPQLRPPMLPNSEETAPTVRLL